MSPAPELQIMTVFEDMIRLKEMTEDEMVGRRHQLSGDKFERTLGDGEGLGSLACCSPWGHKESDTTLNHNTDKLSVRKSPSKAAPHSLLFYVTNIVPILRHAHWAPALPYVVLRPAAKTSPGGK